MKSIFTVLLISILICTCTACSDNKAESINQISGSQSVNASGTTTNGTQNSSVTSNTISVEYNNDDMDDSLASPDISYIILEKDKISLNGKGASIDDNKITITAAGVYSISGTLNDGQIIVDSNEQETIKLILNGVNIYCSSSSPLYIANSKKTVITLADGTTNYLTDGTSYIFTDTEQDEPNAAVFSKDDLTINGSGSLIVEANYNNGIQSKDDLKIVSGNITVTAVNDGIKGRNFIAIKDANITVNAGGDGMQSNNDENPDQGYVLIEGGIIDITAGEDGIQAETVLMLTGGNITISSGGGSTNSSSKAGTSGNTWGIWGRESTSGNVDSSGSAKGLKAGVNVVISGGTITVDSSDDSIHSNESLTISGGDIVLVSGDDGIHADTAIEINGGDIEITKSYEGIESSNIIINNGNIHLIASDDGINAVGGVDGSSLNGRPGQNNFSSSGANCLYINGGYIVIDADGDGMDINGAIYMTGGTVIINGPTRNDNGALDYLSGCKITGGFLIAAGSSGMAQAPDSSSSQYSVMVNFTTTQSAGSIIHLEAASGDEILTFVPTKTYQSIVLSSPELVKGTTYFVYTGGNSTGTAIDGLYTDGTYTGGTQITSFTTSSIVTLAGSSAGGFPGNIRR